jgi:hypothetical protein
VLVLNTPLARALLQLLLALRRLLKAAQVETSRHSLKAAHHIVASSAETKLGSSWGQLGVNLCRPAFFAFFFSATAFSSAEGQTSHIYGGDLLPFRNLSLFLSQLVLEA